MMWEGNEVLKFEKGFIYFELLYSSSGLFTLGMNTKIYFVRVYLVTLSLQLKLNKTTQTTIYSFSILQQETYPKSR